MNDQAKTKEQLINELVEARGRCTELQSKMLDLGQIQDALRESEEKFRSVLQTTVEGVCVVQDGTLKFINRCIAKFMGYPEDELIGRRFTDFVHADDSEAVLERYSEQLTGQRHKPRFNFRVIDSNGTTKWLNGGTARISWEGKPAVSLFAIDISQRKQMEQALKESEKRYRQLVENANDIIYLTDANGHFLVFNAVGLKTIGCSEEEIVHKHYLDLIHPDYREQAEKFYGRQFVKRIPDTYYEVPIVSCQEETIWIGQNVQLVMEGDVVVGFQAVCRDITDRKRAEEELRESEERLELALKGGDLGSWDWNLKTGCAVWNERAIQMLGYSSGEVETNLRTWKSLVHPEDWPHVSEVLNSHLAGRVSFIELEYRLRCKSGDWKWVLSRGKVVAYDTDGTPLRITGTSLDITERKQMEQALRESEERYRAIFNNAAVGINLSDRQTRFLQVNSRSASMLGYTQEELQALTAFDITHPDDRESSRANFAALVEGKVDSYRLQKRFIRKDGEVIWGDTHVSAIHNERGEFVANLGVIVDITDLKRVEQERERMRAQLLHARKMEAIGTLTGGIAHEFNNLLTIVSGYAELLLAEKNECDQGFSDLQKIVHAAQRGAELVRSLLAYSRRSEMNVAPLNLNHEVEQVKKLLDRTLPKMIEIEVNLSRGLKTVEADSGQVRQILMNLALNARDAMPEGGKLSIKTGNVDKERLTLPLGAEPRDYVELTVSDTGIGMDRDTLDRIFEPFYSTKGLAYKTGLGLAVVHGIIEQHGGCVICDSKPGQGTTFKIYFPAAEARKPVEAPVQTQALGGTETILLVDDEEHVRDLAIRFLEHVGYRVITAEDARMALDLYDKERSNISLVILDLIMPKMGGRLCLEELLKLEPKLKVLIASGYSDVDNREKIIRAGAKGFVGKPFQITELLKAIRDVLDAD